MTLSDLNIELQVLIRAGEAALDKTQKTALDEWLKDKTPDWDKVYRLAYLHQIRPLILRGVSGLSQNDVPAAFIDKLKKDCFHISTRSLANTHEMLRLLQIFKQQGILAVPYKGAYLANQYYGDFGLREFSDIDLFVKEEDIDRLKEVMAGEGYVSPYNMTREQEIWNRKIDYDYTFDKRDEKGNRLFHVELHYRTASYSFSINMRLENTCSQVFMGKTLETLKEEDHIIFLLTHHGIMESWSILKYFFDFKQILDKKNFNWQVLLSKTNQYHITPTLLAAVCVIKTFFPSNILDNEIQIDSKAKLLSKDIIKKMEQFQGFSSNLNRHWRSLIHRIKFDKRPIVVINHLAPLLQPSKTDFAIIEKSDVPIAVYYFIRPIRMFASLVSSFFRHQKI